MALYRGEDLTLNFSGDIYNSDSYQSLCVIIYSSTNFNNKVYDYYHYKDRTKNSTIDLNDDTFKLKIPSRDTKDMLGPYTIEIKITEGEGALIEKTIYVQENALFVEDCRIKDYPL